MTFWIDAQLDPDLVPWLGIRFGVVAKHLVELGLAQAPDAALFAAAKKLGDVVLISKDRDFVALSARLGQPPQIVHLRCGNLSTIETQALLARALPDALDRLRQGEAVVEILGQRK